MTLGYNKAPFQFATLAARLNRLLKNYRFLYSSDRLRHFSRRMPEFFTRWRPVLPALAGMIPSAQAAEASRFRMRTRL